MILEQNFTFSPKMLEPPSPIQSVARANHSKMISIRAVGRYKSPILLAFGRRAMTTKKTKKHIQFWKNPD